jgi:hypothetical protein
MASRWARAVFRVAGESHVPDDDIGINVKPINDETYLAKIGLEASGILQKSARNGNRTAWQIAQDAAAGDPRSIRLWQEFAEARHGSRQLSWSLGARQAFGLQIEQDDEAIEQEKPIDEEVVRVPAAEWRTWPTYAVVILLRAIERRDTEEIARALIAGRGFGRPGLPLERAGPPS